ncbi:hypothetical protein CC77DRAFT_1056983 [Alternaria alternata]|uniref:Uncharacterized protein n=1 Tax=Alternaria alternata TaxID=5599 RepID=A0A177DZT7_ALTAL|nr:hypothetical protein CC77DRAFT_1056983 [Alternaria alternata]OAG25187.1 hypothetical protein CC77DRAFT_1056983 [Alternaria alternata]OWY45020.1 hypothetical protein AALT_g3885 [Alternaria alternata]RYN66546.1 hypothetical protein AA0118_g2781 [Alternaria tenuissima]RYN86205.1 hypothetical protein AA0120_g8299 [Alternaria tenuissima]
MSYSAPFQPNPDYDVDAALLDILVHTHHPAVSSGPAADVLARIEKQYQDCVRVLEERNAALVEEGEAAAAKIERLETEVCALEGDVETQLAVLQDRAECVFVQTHIVPDKVVVLRVGEEKWSGIFKEA